MITPLRWVEFCNGRARPLKGSCYTVDTKDGPRRFRYPREARILVWAACLALAGMTDYQLAQRIFERGDNPTKAFKALYFSVQQHMLESIICGDGTLDDIFRRLVASISNERERRMGMH